MRSSSESNWTWHVACANQQWKLFFWNLSLTQTHWHNLTSLKKLLSFPKWRCLTSRVAAFDVSAPSRGPWQQKWVVESIPNRLKTSSIVTRSGFPACKQYNCKLLTKLVTICFWHAHGGQRCSKCHNAMTPLCVCVMAAHQTEWKKAFDHTAMPSWYKALLKWIHRSYTYAILRITTLEWYSKSEIHCINL